MLHGQDFGCRQFMGCNAGLGVFVAEAGDNRLAIHQGANEGFRAIYVYVFAGPDRGKGFVVLCNADNRGVLFISEVAQTLLKALNVSGVDVSKFGQSFDFSKVSQEQIVNLGYKNLVFNAFEPMLPEPIEQHGPPDPLAEYNLLSNASISYVSNQRFARAENLFSPCEPVFDPLLFGKQGKIMDSWESVRHNPMPCDALELRLKKSGSIQYIKLSTKYHDGNQAPLVRILGRHSASESWVEFLPQTTMEGHSQRLIKLERPTALMSEVRVEMIPDGGLSRVGLYPSLPKSFENQFKLRSEAKCERCSDPIPHSKKPLTIPYQATPAEIALNRKRVPGKTFDEACAAFGARLVRATNEHYGPAVQVISPFPPIHMFDGLESARSRKPGHFEEVEIELGSAIVLDRVVFDFEYFVNNNPRSVVVFAQVQGQWQDVSGDVPVKAFAANQKEVRFKNSIRTKSIRVRTIPDGGINRIHVYGRDSS